MKIVVVGGTGLIGRKLIPLLSQQGHDAVSASPSSGVNTLTGAGVPEVLADAQVVVDVSNSPSFEDKAVYEFFTKSTGNLLTAEAAAGVKHHVILSVVGADSMTESGYMRAKDAQEKLVQQSGIPYTIIRATQFFEFLEGIAASSTVGDQIRLPIANMQPLAADDVAAEVARVAVATPANAVIEVAGPDALPIEALVRRYFERKHDTRTVSGDPAAKYFGIKLKERSLLPAGKSPRISATNFAQWLEHVK